MARKAVNLRINVSDLGLNEGKREIEVKVQADNNLFATSDICAKEGVIQSFQKVFELKIKEALSDYSKSGPEFLNHAKERYQSEEKAAI